MFGDSMKSHEESLAPVATHGLGEVESASDKSNNATEDAVFGKLSENGPNYRNVSGPGPRHKHVLLTDVSGWMGWLSSFDVQDSSRSWCPWNSGCF